MTCLLEDLPNPRLAEFLPKEFELEPEVVEICKEYRGAYSWQWSKLDFLEQASVFPLRAAHLKAAGLPEDYDSLNTESKRLARFKTFRSWYNTKHPNILSTNTNNLLKSLYLWVEEYVKPAERNLGTYFNRDPAHKYDMVRAAFGAPKNPNLCSKTLVTAPRGSTKTRTLIGQMVPMMCCTRPYTEVLVSEINDTRTVEECTFIIREIEENERIQEDFGGRGTLFPMSSRGSKRWTPKWMDFAHHPGTRIIGSSWKSNTRGRHPILWIIDDPEDPRRPMGVEERQEFWAMLFRRGLPMLGRGAAFLWISTLILGGCCHRAMMMTNQEDESVKAEMGDARFDDWRVVNFDLLQADENGQMRSIYPDHLSTDAYTELETSLGKREAMAEYRGIATAGGEFVFQRDPIKHGYMRCKNPGGGEDYFLDLETGTRMPWDQFLAGLYRSQASDISNSTDRDADYGATIVCGVDSKQLPTFYVLDAWLKQALSDELVWQAYVMSSIWSCEKIGFESVGLQNIVLRYAAQYADKLEAQGHTVPKLLPIKNYIHQKERRIIATLRVLYAHNRIKFPCFGEVATPDGKIHVAAPHPSERYFSILFSQLDMFTDAGASGPDDGPDALQMTVALLRGERGYEKIEKNDNEEQMKAWAQGGVVWTHSQVPMEAWTPEMWEQARTCVPELGDQDIYD